MSLVGEYEAAKVRTARMQRIATTLTDSLGSFHSAIQELHDIFVDTFNAGLDAQVDETSEKWMSEFQESLEQTELHLGDLCKSLRDHLLLPFAPSRTVSETGQNLQNLETNFAPDTQHSLHSLHAKAKFLDCYYAGIATCVSDTAKDLIACMTSAADNENRKLDLLGRVPKAFTTSREESAKFLRLLPSVVLPGPIKNACQIPIPRPRHRVPENIRVQASLSADLVQVLQ